MSRRRRIWRWLFYWVLDPLLSGIAAFIVLTVLFWIVVTVYAAAAK